MQDGGWEYLREKARTPGLSISGSLEYFPAAGLDQLQIMKCLVKAYIGSNLIHEN